MSEMREDFAAAIEELDVEEDLEVTPQEIEVYDADDTSVADTVDNEEDTESGGEAETPTSAEEVKADSSDSDLPDGTADKPVSHKAPAGWAPKEREQWSKVPANLQERILGREQEMADTMANTKEARSLQTAFQQMGQSYAPLMSAEGFSHPMEAMEAAFGTMTNLRMGTPQQKASEIARIINQYGVDIETLDNALVNGGGGQQQQQQQGYPQNQQFEQMLDQRMAPVNQLMQTVQDAQEHQQQQKMNQASNEVAQFAQKNEFLADVREDMADIIELAGKRGVNLNLQTAYDRATAAHPEIANVMMQRRSDAQLKGRQNSLAGKRNAGSSLSGRRAGSGGGNSSASLRDAISAAFDRD